MFLREPFDVMAHKRRRTLNTTFSVATFAAISIVVIVVLLHGVFWQRLQHEAVEIGDRLVRSVVTARANM